MPKKARNDQIFRKRYAYVLASQFCDVFLTIGYGAWSTAFKKIPSEYQWILAIICPLYRQFHTWVKLKLGYKAAGTRELRTQRLTAIYKPKAQYAFFLAISVPVATQATVYIFLIIDFCINIYTALEIVYLKKYTKKENSETKGRFCYHLPMLNEFIMSTKFDIYVCLIS